MDIWRRSPETVQCCLRTCISIVDAVFVPAASNAIFESELQSLFRSKVGTPPHLTDREIFEQLPLGDVWHDAHMLEAWDFLWKHAQTRVPDSWLECMTRFDREFRDTIG